MGNRIMLTAQYPKICYAITILNSLVRFPTNLLIVTILQFACQKNTIWIHQFGSIFLKTEMGQTCQKETGRINCWIKLQKTMIKQFIHN